MKEIKEQIEVWTALLPVAKSISLPEAERRAGIFLSAQAAIANWRHDLGEDKIKALSMQSATYSQELSKGTDKTVTVNKINAEASAEYTAAREDLERIENDLSYLRAYAEIFQNSHVFYRQMAKGDGI